MLLALTGCGQSGLVPVRGIVILDGKPLARATVVFIAADDGGRDANGFTDAEGKFELSTLAPKDGALPGAYKIVIQYSEPGEPAGEFTSAEEARKAGVKAAAARPRKMPLLPAIYTEPDQTVLKQQVPAPGLVTIELHSVK